MTALCGDVVVDDNMAIIMLIHGRDDAYDVTRSKIWTPLCKFSIVGK